MPGGFTFIKLNWCRGRKKRKHSLSNVFFPR